MPYARPNRTSTTPRPTAKRPKRAIDVAGPQNPAATLAEATGTWNFAARVWIAFDGPKSISPNWIDISAFVATDIAINITHGRADGLSDVNATTCSLTVDNSDGRFLAANPAGVWFGQIGKGNWLKVEIFPPSGVVSSRFVGFVTSLPNQWSGQYQYGQITASDRFEKLGQAPAIVSMVQSEILTDPNLASGIRAYWNLHEPSGALTFGDTSGQGARHLLAVGVGVLAGTGFGASKVSGPGFDGLQAVAFNPPSSTQGTYLTAPISLPTGSFSGLTYTGLLGTIEIWYQATTTATTQYIAAIYDPIAGYAVQLTQHPNGTCAVFTTHTNPGTPAGFGTSLGSVYSNATRIDDGAWHHLVFGVAATASGGGAAEGFIMADGLQQLTFSISQGTSNLSQIIIGGGWDVVATGVFRPGAYNISDVAWTWANNPETAATLPAAAPDYYSHARAGQDGFYGESTDVRVARIARYANVPIPTAATVPTYPNWATGFALVQTYTPGVKGPWTNLAAGAHVVGTQSVSGRKSLDVMQEAARTESMPLFEDRSGYLTIQNSTIRQNTSPAWSVNALDLDPATAMADDFTYTTNQMTVTPNGQATQTVIGLPGSAGRLSQSKYGEYDGSQATASVNPIEAQSLGLGVIQLRADPGPRLAPLAVEVSTTALLPGYGNAWFDAVLATDISTPVRVTNAPAAVGGGNYDCLVEGYSETITAGNLLIAFTISQIQGPTYQLDDIVLGHIDTDGSTLAGSTLNTTALTFQVATTNAGSPLWTRAGADFPFDVRIDGEQITISGISGASSPQTATASARSVNGVVASHNVGAAVSLWQPLTLAY